jgi:integrase/recombinase XerD
MIESYYVRPDTVDRIRSSWISDAIEAYVTWLHEQKYSERSILRRIPILVRFGEFARARGAERIEQLPSHLEDFVGHWIEERLHEKKAVQPRKRIAKDVRNPIQQMLRVALPGYVGVGRCSLPENPFFREAPDFFAHLRQEKGLRPKTLNHYSHYLRRFAGYLASIGLHNLGHLSPPVLSGFVAELSRQVRWASVRNACGTVRVFLRYLHREGLIKQDFSRLVEHPQSYRLSSVPRSITWDEVRRMLEVVDRRMPVGKRDYAILLLLVTYGLRGHEVASLSLDHIDWRNERLHVPERKAGHCAIYPLSPLVGQAILEYLKSRPETPERRVFLRYLAPCRPLTAAAVSGRASHYLHKAGIPVSKPGSHTLRHTCVQRLVDAGMSLHLIGQYVGHRSASSTQIYAKVAVEALREVALGDGEEVV